MKRFGVVFCGVAGILFMLGTIPGVAVAQGTGAIRGAVTTLAADGGSIYLPGIQIILRCENHPENARTAVTDVTGRFSLPGLSPGACNITALGQTVLGPEYRSETQTVEVPENAAVELSFQLNLQTAAAPGTGAIRGEVAVLAPDGASVYLPGGEIVLLCETATGNARTAVTDETGKFSLSGLAADRCNITASAPGLQSETQTVEVAENVVVELSFRLRLQTVEEEITVSGQAPLIETVETSPKEELQGSVVEHMPLPAERATDTLPLTPGVVRGADGLINVKGARATESGLLVNSANVADPVTGEYAFDLPVETLQSVKVLSNPYDTQYGKFTGAVTSVATRSGQDKFRLQYQNIFPRFRVRDGHLTGIAGVSPRLTLGGPIKKGKAYFSQALEYRFFRTRVRGLRHLDSLLKSDTKFESLDSHSRLDLNLNPMNHLVFSLSIFPQKRGFVNLNTFNPQEVTPNFKQRGFLLGISEQKFFTSQAFLESLFSVKDFDANIFPAGDPLSPMILIPEENAGSFFNRQDRQSRRYEWQEMYHFGPLRAGGNHLLKIGGNVSHINFSGINASRPVWVRRSDGTLAERIEFSGTTAVGRSSTEFALFFQDKWNPHPRITLDFGVRYDRDTLGQDNNVSPRVGFSLALTNDNRTVLRGGVGLFYDKITLNIGAFEQLQSARRTRFAADGVMALGPSLQFQNVIQNGDLDNPYSLAWNVELEREIARDFVIRFSHQQRRSRRGFIVDPIAAPQPVRLLSNSGRSLYREFQITARYRFLEQDQLVVSYVRSRSYGDLNDFNQFFGNFEDPILRPNERSLQPFDTTNRFLAWGDFKLPADLTLSPVVEIRDGFPFSLIDQNRDFVGPRNRAGRFPEFVSVDLEITKGFKLPLLGKLLGKNRKVRAGIRIFNLTGHFNPGDFQNIIGTNPVAFREVCTQSLIFCNDKRRSFRGKFVIEF